MNENTMAKVGGGLLKLDAICAKLKQNQLAGNQSPIQGGSPSIKASSDVSEANNNVSEADEEKTDLPSPNGQGTPISDNSISFEALSNKAKSSSNGHNGAYDYLAAEQPIGAISEPSTEVEDTADPESLPLTPSQDEPTKSTQESSTPRKSRRKNQKPRNIMQYDSNDIGKENEEIEDYELNNKDVDFDAMINEEETMEMEKESALDLSKGDMNEENLAAQQRFVRVAGCLDVGNQDQSEETYFSTDDFGAMDLSFNKVDPSSSGRNSRQSESYAASDDLSSSQTSSEISQQDRHILSDKHSGSRIPTKPLGGSSSEAADIKNYAENTMNELLSMYGLEDGESLTSNVPLQTFTSSSILERQSLAGGAIAASPNEALKAKLLPKLSYLQLISQNGKRASMGSNVDGKTSITSTSISPSSSGGYNITSLARSVIGQLLPRSFSGVAHPPVDPPPIVISPEGLGYNPASGGHPAPSKSSGTLTRVDGLKGTVPSGSGYTNASYDPSFHSPPSVSVNPGGKGFLPDYGKYVKRFNSYEECGGQHCRDMAYKEHFHCMDCDFRVFVKKEEMIRHFKWHKKRDESLQHGFLRFSPMDNCSKKFLPCTHNGRQTHYHCLQQGCTKVYISTSDVQMHANYHRKDSAIIQEGFQRFRATEDCGTIECSFYGQRTTHFHCRRTDCMFTFKNKADMEKHKTYHQKDEVLSKDGFKKFMKYEHCSYQSCRYSKVSNHIHCIRPGCDYVLHSTGQLFSHKRKHERRDFEHAYKRFKDVQKSKVVVNPAIRPMLDQHMAQQIAQQTQQTGQATPAKAKSPSVPVGFLKKDQEYVDLEDLCQLNQSGSSNGLDSENETLSPTDLSQSPSLNITKTMHNTPPNVIEIKPEGSGLKALPSTLAKLASKLQSSQLSGSLNLSIPSGEVKEQSEVHNSPTTTPGSTPQKPGNTPQSFVVKVSPPVNEKRERDETWKKYLTRYTANDPCHSRCKFLYKDHYHCNIPRCTSLFRSKDGVREHAKHHEQQDRITTLSFMVYDEGVACVQGCAHSTSTKHYHCLWADCKHVVKEDDSVFARLEHHKIHEFTRNSVGRKSMTVHVPHTPESFKRKRGRPPKYPKNEIPLIPKIAMTDEEINTQARGHPGDIVIGNGFCTFGNGDPCPDDKCMYYLKEHFHCLRQRCHHATDRTDMLNLHAKDFHSYINIIEGFEFFDRNINCRRPHCHNNRANRHFHCVKPRCDYSFVRYSTMSQHAKKHELAETGCSPGSVSSVSPLMSSPRSNQSSLPRSAVYTSTATPQQILNTANSSSLVKASGTFFPISTIPKGSGQIYVSSGDGTVQITNTPPVMVPVPHGSNQVPKMMTTQSSTVQPVAPIVIVPVSSPSTLVNIAPKPAEAHDSLKTSRPMPSALPLSALLLQKSANLPQLNWLNMKMKMHYGVLQNCGRPFCKLKKKDHYHCFECNQAFSDPIRLKSHVAKHGLKVDPTENIHGHPVIPESVELENAGPYCSDSGGEESEDGLDPNSSLNLNPQAFTNLMKSQPCGEQEKQEEQDSEEEGALVMDLSMPSDKGHQQEELMSGVENTGESPSGDEPAMEGVDDGPITENEELQDELGNPDTFDTNSGGESQPENQDGVNPARRSSRKRTATRHQDFIDSDTVLAKVRRVSSPRANKDDNIPEGYEKFKFNEDCEVERCAYRQNQTHYHCERDDCVYSFSDRSRFIQHNEKHKRLDALMGEEFQQFGQKMDCEHADCEFSCKQSHFHCAKCAFICTDTNKVAAHRKHHSKLGEIAAAGFAKFVGAEACGWDGCGHNQRQTHYHCTQEGCGVVAMGPAQMSAHRVKHQTDVNS